MSDAPSKSFLAKTLKDVLVNVAGTGVIYLAGCAVTWLWTYLPFGGLLPAVWAHLTSPVPVPLGLLLAGVWFVGGNLFVFYVLSKVRRNIHPLAATSLGAAALLAVVVALSAGVYIFRGGEPPRPRGSRPLTDTGNVVQAAVSPDGKFFVYAADHGDGQQSLSLGQVDQPSARLTISGPGEARYGGLAFSPDGLRVYFVKYECNGTVGTLFQMATLGGEPTKIKERIPRFFSYAVSPDGASIAFVRNSPEEAQSELVTADTAHPGKERQVAARRKPEQFMGVPAWSPDGALLTCAVMNAETGRARLVGIGAASKEEEFGRDVEWQFVGQVSSLPNGGSLLLAAPRIFGPFQMWRVPYPGGRAEMLTVEGKNYDGMSLTADSGAALTVEDTLEDTVWVTEPGRPDLAREIKSHSGKHNDYWGFSWTRDGRVLYVKNEEGGGQHIRVMSAEDGKPLGTLTRDGDNVDPCATADGRYIVFTKREGGAYNIWRMNADGENPKRLTKGGKDFAPHCSDDGAVVYTSEQNGQWVVQKIGIDNDPDRDAPRRLHHQPSQWPAVSRGGSVAFFTVAEDNTIKLGVLRPDGTTVETHPLPCTVSTWAELRWLNSEQELAYVDTQGGVSNIWSFSLRDSSRKRLTNFDRYRIFRYDRSPDGRFVLSRGPVKRNAILFNFREPARGPGG